MKNNPLYFVSGKNMGFNAHYLILPIAYGLLCHGFNKYWLKNDLRHLYRDDLLKPQYRRLDNALQSDYRDIKAELSI